jgi:hypothetical protein
MQKSAPFGRRQGDNRVEHTVAKIRLSDEARSIEAVIETGTEHEALAHLLDAEPILGRRPEYRYLRLLFDHVFSTRPKSDVLRDLVALVGDQPDLTEATALLAELYDGAGEPRRADLFAQIALESQSPTARRRASAVLSRHGIKVPGGDEEPADAAAPADAEGAAQGDIAAWFEHAKHNLVQRRAETFGVRSLHSAIDMLLEAGAKIALGPSAFGPSALPLTRESLARIDESVVQVRKAFGAGSASRSDVSRTNAAAGFFLAVVLHELGGTAVETAASDGGCKVMVPSGGGARPLLVAAAFAEGAGPGLTQTFDRLAASLELAAPSSAEPSLTPAPRSRRFLSTGAFPVPSADPPPSSGRVSARGARPAPKLTARFGTPIGPAVSPPEVSAPRHVGPATPPPVAAPAPPAAVSAAETPIAVAPRSGATLPPPVMSHPAAGAAAARIPTPVAMPTSDRVSSRPPASAAVAVSREVLVFTRAQAEAQTARRLERPVRPGERPALDMLAVAAALAETPLGYEIAARTGKKLIATPNNVEALESYMSSTRGRAGAAPHQDGWQPSDAEESLILSWGAFVGEALIATYGGVWECDPNAPTDPRLFRVVCDDRVATWPVTRVYLRLKNGAAHDLIEFIAEVGKLLA